MSPSTSSSIGTIVYLLKAVPWQIPGFTVETHLSQLESIDREITSTGPLLVHANRLFLMARN